MSPAAAPDRHLADRRMLVKVLLTTIGIGEAAKMF
jgi:hypothetical protein